MEISGEASAPRKRQLGLEPRHSGTTGTALNCWRMTKFFFDTDEPNDVDDDGLELPDVEAALTAALEAFPDMIRDREPTDGQSRFGLTVRSATQPLFRVTLELFPSAVGENSASAEPGRDSGMPSLANPDGAHMKTEDELIAEIAERHGVGRGAVSAAREALARGNGSMAQFSHADFGGMAQWSKGGMSMVGDMFDTALKAKLDGVMADLSSGLDDNRQGGSDPGQSPSTTKRATASGDQRGSSWPPEFGPPSSSGGQNDMRYAFFPKARRLIVEDASKRTIYDTGSHMISGVSQQQSGTGSMKFQCQDGDLRLDELPVVG